MNCPECKSKMMPEQHSGITIDRCGGCQSLWFDPGELEHYLQAMIGQDQPFQLDFEAAAPASISQSEPLPPRDLDCPKCIKTRLERGESGHITLSRCGYCQGIYVSGDEVVSALTGGKVAGKKSVLRVAGDVADTGLMIFSDLLIEIFS